MSRWLSSLMGRRHLSSWNKYVALESIPGFNFRLGIQLFKKKFLLVELHQNLKMANFINGASACNDLAAYTVLQIFSFSVFREHWRATTFSFWPITVKLCLAVLCNMIGWKLMLKKRSQYSRLNSVRSILSGFWYKYVIIEPILENKVLKNSLWRCFQCAK